MVGRGMKVDPYSVPIVINCRDRVTPLRQLVDWLEAAGYMQLVLVDNDSTWPELLAYLDETPHRVIRLGENRGWGAPWSSGVVDEIAGGGRYVVTDPDVVPDDSCPADVVARLWRVLDLYPRYLKVGLGLRVDDLPESFALRDHIRRHEAQFHRRPIGRGLYRAAVDTTFALYREGVGHVYSPALRTRKPYLARHLTWYTDSANPTPEEAHYAAHALESVAKLTEAPVDDVPRYSRLDRARWYRHSAMLQAVAGLRICGFDVAGPSAGPPSPGAI